MEAPRLQLLMTDSLLLDAVEGIDSIAHRLAQMYDRWIGSAEHEQDAARAVHPADIALVGQVLGDLGWWSGRFEGAVSSETAGALDRLSSDGS